MENSRLKFRVWNGIEMEYNVMVGHLGAFYVRGLDENDSASVSPFNTRYADHVPVMQSTGLHDKNGKEIYEGDILRCDWTARKKHGLEYVQIEEIKDKIQIHEVFYSVHAAGFFMAIDKELSEEKYKDEILLTAFRAKSFTEVIGNIYENPELLNP